MVFLQHLSLKGLIEQYRSEGLSMRRRLALYLILALVMLMSLILMLLNFLGIMNPANYQIINALEGQLSSYARSIERDYDRIAAYAISYSNRWKLKFRTICQKMALPLKNLRIMQRRSPDCSARCTIPCT